MVESCGWGLGQIVFHFSHFFFKFKLKEEAVTKKDCRGVVLDSRLIWKPTKQWTQSPHSPNSLLTILGRALGKNRCSGFASHDRYAMDIYIGSRSTHLLPSA